MWHAVKSRTRRLNCPDSRVGGGKTERERVEKDGEHKKRKENTIKKLKTPSFSLRWFLSPFKMHAVEGVKLSMCRDSTSVRLSSESNQRPPGENP